MNNQWSQACGQMEQVQAINRVEGDPSTPPIAVGNRRWASQRPSRLGAEQTTEYTPPEALLNETWYHGPTTVKYDMWSVGVVMLELILGSPDVFQISALTRTLLDQHLEGWSEGVKQLAYRLRSLMEMCILMPGRSVKHRFGGSMYKSGVSLAPWKCSEEFFLHQIKSRDPLKIGFSDVQALRLVRHLLLWDPDDRFSVNEALQHPYFETLRRT